MQGKSEPFILEETPSVVISSLQIGHYAHYASFESVSEERFCIMASQKTTVIMREAGIKLSKHNGEQVSSSETQQNGGEYEKKRQIMQK